MTASGIIPLHSLQADRAGFEALSQAYEDALHVSGSSLQFDFARVNWIDAHLCAAFLCIVRKIQSKGVGVTFINSSQRVTDILARNGFFNLNRVSETGTVIPVREFQKDDGKSFADYFRRNLNRMRLPTMTGALRGKIFEGVDEIFINASMHSIESTNIFACGQFFPKLDRINFALTDGGIGMCGNYTKTFSQQIKSIDAIDWALKENNTTRSGDVPGGLGLKILREFLQLNGGCFKVVSKWGYWKEENGRLEKVTMGRAFPGTVVSMEINTADTNRYDLMNAPDARDIW